MQLVPDVRLRLPHRRHEAQRQWEVRPSCSYLERHHISEDMRRVAVRWLAEVTTACNLKPATLVLATSYFDRFLSVAKVGRKLRFPASAANEAFIAIAMHFHDAGDA